ncbi:unnamed protein product [Cuscuta europaea]|uniref:Uncharacterized protein n=1 Tax=Cuscuta europaea TaxID=41803 RepID=A0A9P0YIB2_CUSEU|nr:unnamed protein product [Cuscuta europaea]
MVIRIAISFVCKFFCKCVYPSSIFLFPFFSFFYFLFFSPGSYLLSIRPPATPSLLPSIFFPVFFRSFFPVINPLLVSLFFLFFLLHSISSIPPNLLYPLFLCPET